MRCCQSQNREHKRDGDSRYGEDHNVVVCKKHGLHYGLQLLRRPLFGLRLLTYEQFGNRLCVPPDRQEPKDFFGLMEQNRSVRGPETCACSH